jgi:hypothetical protein
MYGGCPDSLYLKMKKKKKNVARPKKKEKEKKSKLNLLIHAPTDHSTMQIMQIQHKNYVVYNASQ